MAKKRISIGLDNFDMFGKQIYLTHDGDEVFKTRFGGFLSILFWIGMISYGI